jgi:hypothetical protein
VLSVSSNLKFGPIPKFEGDSATIALENNVVVNIRNLEMKIIFGLLIREVMNLNRNKIGHADVMRWDFD